MRNQRALDQYDIEAERESLAMDRFRQEIGKSVGQLGTPKCNTRKRPCKKGGSVGAHYQGARTGVWRGLS